jgi:hypothetical protein
MTFEDCHRQLVQIRRRQGTRCPLVRIDCGDAVYQGRLTRSDTDPEYRRPEAAYGIVVLEGLGLTRGPQTVLQIANIPADGIKDMQTN